MGRNTVWPSESVYSLLANQGWLVGMAGQNAEEDAIIIGRIVRGTGFDPGRKAASR
jgi:hypothetical protein